MIWLDWRALVELRIPKIEKQREFLFFLGWKQMFFFLMLDFLKKKKSDFI